MSKKFVRLRTVGSAVVVSLFVASLGLPLASTQPLSPLRSTSEPASAPAVNKSIHGVTTSAGQSFAVKVPGATMGYVTIPPELLEYAHPHAPSLEQLQQWQVTPEDTLSAAAIAADYLGDSHSTDAALAALPAKRANEVRHALDAIHSPVGTPDFSDSSTMIVVLGGGLDESGRVHPELARRLQGGLELARQHPSAKVLVTGGNTGYGYNEAEAMRNWLVRHGLDPQRIIEENNAWSTVSNAWYSAQVLHSAQSFPTSLVVVTSNYHVHRGIVDYSLAFGPEVAITGLGTQATTDKSDNELHMKIYRDAVFWYLSPDAVKADGLPPFVGQNPQRKPATEPDH